MWAAVSVLGMRVQQRCVAGKGSRWQLNLVATRLVVYENGWRRHTTMDSNERTRRMGLPLSVTSQINGAEVKQGCGG